ncbi:hypothetical protein [Fundidesulfovibrio putealis]|uniref:hypothetical protein n=1 Tax=Fundidesulfovibrio putealis TaxID=270496 RepID=UPI0004294EC1|nr:hypothetical protein [Fundidesulfovibrio putealis]
MWFEEGVSLELIELLLMLPMLPELLTPLEPPFEKELFPPPMLPPLFPPPMPPPPPPPPMAKARELTSSMERHKANTFFTERLPIILLLSA